MEQRTIIPISNIIAVEVSGMHEIWLVGCCQYSLCLCEMVLITNTWHLSKGTQQLYFRGELQFLITAGAIIVKQYFSLL